MAMTHMQSDAAGLIGDWQVSLRNRHESRLPLSRQKIMLDDLVTHIRIFGWNNDDQSAEVDRVGAIIDETS